VPPPPARARTGAAPPTRSNVVEFPLLAEHLPGPLPKSLDPVLDATERCIARHGLSKTTMSDIAREMGVVPSTVYRKVGSVENAALLVVGREAMRLLDRMPEVIAGLKGPYTVTAFMAEGVETFAHHPVFSKVLRDDMEWVARVVTRRLDALLERGAEIIAPILEAAMDNGAIRTQDALPLAHWLVRIAGTALMSPPPGELRQALETLLLPVLEPPPRPRRPRS
jgi:AcrR family transcriptional regulator